MNTMKWLTDETAWSKLFKNAFYPLQKKIQHEKATTDKRAFKKMEAETFIKTSEASLNDTGSGSRRWLVLKQIKAIGASIHNS